MMYSARWTLQRKPNKACFKRQAQVRTMEEFQTKIRKLKPLGVDSEKIDLNYAFEAMTFTEQAQKHTCLIGKTTQSTHTPQRK